jgi:hypothetical protein
MTRLQKRNEKRSARIFVGALFVTAGLSAALIIGGSLAFRSVTHDLALNGHYIGSTLVCEADECYRVRRGLRASKPTA